MPTVQDWWVGWLWLVLQPDLKQSSGFLTDNPRCQAEKTYIILPVMPLWLSIAILMSIQTMFESYLTTVHFIWGWRLTNGDKGRRINGKEFLSRSMMRNIQNDQFQTTSSKYVWPFHSKWFFLSFPLISLCLQTFFWRRLLQRDIHEKSEGPRASFWYLINSNEGTFQLILH